MKQLYKSALLAVLGLAGVTAAQAGTTDLLIGFNDNAGPVSAQNDYVIDIGSFATLQADALAAPNYTVDLSGLFNSSTFSTAFSTDPNESIDVAAGVVGGQNPTTPRTLWQTAPVGVTPHTVSGPQLRTAANQPQTTGIVGEYASSTQNTSWTWLVAQSTTLAGTEPSGSVTSSTGTNPMGLLGIGVYPNLILNLWQNTTASSSSNPTSGWVETGYFTFDLQDNSITYTVPVPEPGVYGLVAGAGLLALALRRQFVSKIA